MKRALLLLVLSCQLHAHESYIEIFDRCNEDNLNPDQGKLRNQWAAKCFPVFDANYYSNRLPLRYALVKSRSSNSYKGPTDVNAPCGDWQMIAVCLASCFTADQQVLFGTGYIPIERALNDLVTRIVTLKPESDLEHLSFGIDRVSTYTRTREAALEDVRVFDMVSGGKLSVTTGHPMLLATGVMTTAAQVKVGDFLVKMDGRYDEIARITDIQVFDRVYNVAPVSGNPVANIIVAQGYLTGSAAYQYLEEFSKLLNRKLLRSSIALPPPGS